MRRVEKKVTGRGPAGGFGPAVAGGGSRRSAAASPEAPSAAQSALRAGSYGRYLAGIAEQPAGEAFTLKASAFTENPGGSASRLTEYKGGRDVLMVADQEDSLTYRLQVPRTGRYRVVFRYYPIKGNERPAELGLEVDGAVPFPGAERFTLGRVFTGETAIQKDAQGNEYAPRQVEHFDWFEEPLKLLDGTADDPAELYLEAGEHTLTLRTLSQPYVLDTVAFLPPEAPESYAAYRAGRLDDGGTDFIKIEAESAARKSDQSLRPASDRTSPLTSPYDPGKVRMNILSSSWSQPGQWLEWDFDAPSDGYYALGFRYQQFTNINFFVTRRLSLDGAVPYEEAARLRFAYNLDWRYVTLTDGEGDPLKVYLTKGRHTLRLEAVLGDYGSLLDSLDGTVAALNDLYRQVIVITSVSPDKYQDYYLEREIPGLTDTLRQAADTLAAEFARVQAVTGTEGTQAAILNVFAAQLRSFLEKPESIPLRLSEFKNNVGSLAAWVLDLKSQPMDLDYLYLYQADAPQPKAKAGFFDTLVHEIRSFAASFSEDYNAMGGSGGQESIDVWVGSGRDQAQIIRMMVNDLYTPSHHIGVNLKLVNAGMVEAFLSGQTPDVALTIGRGQPLNLAVRGALADLTQFEDFEKVKDWFLPGALDPYYFESGCFGLPDTQSFYMLFYRTDILEELNVAPPRTWEEFYAAIPAIQRANMEVGIPYTTVDAFGAADARAGGTQHFPGAAAPAGRELLQRGQERDGLGHPGGGGGLHPVVFPVQGLRAAGVLRLLQPVPHGGNPAGHRLLHRICPAGIRGAGDPGTVGNGAHTRSGPLRRHHRPGAGGIWLRLRHPEPDGEAGGLLGFPEMVLLGGGADPLRQGCGGADGAVGAGGGGQQRGAGLSGLDQRPAGGHRGAAAGRAGNPGGAGRVLPHPRAGQRVPGRGVRGEEPPGIPGAVRQAGQWGDPAQEKGVRP